MDALASDLGFVLKSEQKEAVESPLKGRDFFGVLPTGFGKGLIFQLFVLAKNRDSNSSNASSVERPTIIVICPLKSLIEEQITSNAFSLSAAELKFPNCVLKQQPHNLRLSDAVASFGFLSLREAGFFRRCLTH